MEGRGARNNGGGEGEGQLPDQGAQGTHQEHEEVAERNREQRRLAAKGVLADTREDGYKEE